MNLNRDFLKTLGGILVIGAIVVATFLVGNQQRQDQIRKENQAQQKAPVPIKKNQPAANSGSSSSPAAGKSTVGGGSIPQTGPSDIAWLILPAAATGFFVARRRKSYQY